MTYSCSDLADDVHNELVEHGFEFTCSDEDGPGTIGDDTDNWRLALANGTVVQGEGFACGAAAVSNALCYFSGRVRQLVCAANDLIASRESCDLAKGIDALEHALGTLLASVRADAGSAPAAGVTQNDDLKSLEETGVWINPHGLSQKP